MRVTLTRLSNLKPQINADERRFKTTFRRKHAPKAVFINSPGGAPSCPHSRPKVTSVVTRQESSESMRAEVSTRKKSQSNLKPLRIQKYRPGTRITRKDY